MTSKRVKGLGDTRRLHGIEKKGNMRKSGNSASHLGWYFAPDLAAIRFNAMDWDEQRDEKAKDPDILNLTARRYMAI